MVESAVAFNWTTIAPYIPSSNSLTHVDATVGTLFGAISVGWTKQQATCAQVNEGSTLVIDMGSFGVIEDIVFASFGTPNGECGNFTIGDCNAASSLKVVQQACVGKSSCSIPATNEYGVHSLNHKLTDCRLSASLAAIHVSTLISASMCK